MHCPKCGTKNPEGAVFCENCGNRLKADSILDKKKDSKQKSITAIVVLIIGMLIFLTSMLLFGNSLIITIIGAVVMLLGFSLLKKSH